MKPHVIVIGAGFTGVAIAHDLALRGFAVTVVERGPIANGTSGRTNGILHSGGRYAVNDRESAIECIRENQVLRRIVPDVIEPNGGLFVAINDEDMAYREKFIEGCTACGIPIQELNPREALRLEPNLNPNILTAITVPDGTFDPLRLAMAFAATARSNGAVFNLYTDVIDLLSDGQGNIKGVKALNRATNQILNIEGDIVVNATGAWVGQITAKVGINVPITLSPGVMVAYDNRLTNRNINWLNVPGDGDVVMPQRRLVVVGTTSFVVKSPDYVPVERSHIQLLFKRGTTLVPKLKEARERGVWVATRPLIGGVGPERSISRTFKAYDHKETDNVEGLVTITGGKATTLRLMAEKTVDLICKKFNLNIPCTTAETPLDRKSVV